MSRSSEIAPGPKVMIASANRRPVQMEIRPAVRIGELDDSGHDEKTKRRPAGEESEREQDRQHDFGRARHRRDEFGHREGDLGAEDMELVVLLRTGSSRRKDSVNQPSQRVSPEAKKGRASASRRTMSGSQAGTSPKTRLVIRAIGFDGASKPVRAASAIMTAVLGGLRRRRRTRPVRRDGSRSRSRGH